MPKPYVTLTFADGDVVAFETVADLVAFAARFVVGTAAILDAAAVRAAVKAEAEMN